MNNVFLIVFMIFYKELITNKLKSNPLLICDTLSLAASDKVYSNIAQHTAPLHHSRSTRLSIVSGKQASASQLQMGHSTCFVISLSDWLVKGSRQKIEFPRRLTECVFVSCVACISRAERAFIFTPRAGE